MWLFDRDVRFILNETPRNIYVIISYVLHILYVYNATVLIKLSLLRAYRFLVLTLAVLGLALVFANAIYLLRVAYYILSLQKHHKHSSMEISSRRIMFHRQHFSPLFFVR